MADDVIGVQNIGNKVIVENVGAKRILGNQLVAQAKIANWMFFITDIDSMAVYANQGTDVWIGAFGQTVAGSTTLRLGLSPFEGQKFYDLDLNTAFTFTGGAWNGGAIKSNLLSPTDLILTAATTLTRGRAHVIAADGNYVLPSTTDPLEDTIAGHHMEVYVARGFSAVHIVAPGAEDFIDNIGATSTDLLLNAGGLYTIVFKAGQWELFYIDVVGLQAGVDSKLSIAANLSDVANAGTSRTNLSVDSTAEVDTKVATKLDKTTTIGVTMGILKTGTLQADTLNFGADFATPAEASDPFNVVKVLNPSHIDDAVSSATKSSALNNITGLAPKGTESKFLLVVDGGDANKVNFPEFTAVFNTDPFLRNDTLITVTVPAGQIVLPNNGGTPTSHFVKVNSLGVLSIVLTKPPLESLTEIFLGLILEISGDAMIINNGPWLASSGESLRISLDRVSGGIVIASATVGKVKQDAISFFRESVNWEQSTTNPHVNTIVATDPTIWTYVDRFGAVIGSLNIDEVDGDTLDDATNVPNNSYSVQIMFTSSEGVLVVLSGQEIFSNLTLALAAVESYAPILPTVLDTTVEISRWVVKGNQFPGSGSLDLTDTSNFQPSAGLGVSGASVSTDSANITSSNTNNDLADTNLQLQIDELANRGGISQLEYHQLVNPLISLFKKNKQVDTLRGTFTWTRTTTATFIDRYGVIVTAAIDEPREDKQGWFREGEGIQLFIHTEEFDNAAWTKSSAVIVVNATAAPDKAVTADGIDAGSTATIAPAIFQAITVVASTSHTVFIFAKQNEDSFIQISFSSGEVTGDPRANFDLNLGILGTVDSEITATIEKLSNGYFKCSATVTTLITTLTPFFILIKSATDTRSQANNWTAGDGIFAWGANVKKLPFADSYIPATTIQVTRAADLPSVLVDSNFISQTEGDHTQFIAYKLLGDTGNVQRLYTALAIGGSAGRYNLQVNNSTANTRYRDGSTTEVGTGPDTFGVEKLLVFVTEGGVLKVYDSTGLIDSASNVVTDLLDTSVTLDIGHTNNSFHMFGYLSGFDHWDFALNPNQIKFLLGV